MSFQDWKHSILPYSIYRIFHLRLYINTKYFLSIVDNVASDRIRNDLSTIRWNVIKFNEILSSFCLCKIIKKIIEFYQIWQNHIKIKKHMILIYKRKEKRKQCVVEFIGW